MDDVRLLKLLISEVIVNERKSFFNYDFSIIQHINLNSAF